MESPQSKDCPAREGGWTWMAAVALACASATTCVTATLLGLARSKLDPTIAWISLATGFVAALCTLYSLRGEARRTAVTPPAPCSVGMVLASIAFALFALRAFGWLCYRNDETLFVTSPNNLGDLALHLTFIQHLSSGAAFWPDNPVFAGHPLRYPLGTDLLNATLCLCGFDIYQGLILVGFTGSFATWAALRKWGGAFAIFGFLCAGGLAGFALLWTGKWVDYQSALAWKSLPLALFVTQRGLLHAIPCGLLLLDSWRSRFETSPARRPLPMVVEWLIYGSLPLFHLHSFIFLSLILLVLCIFGSRRLRQHALLLASTSFLPATSLVLLVSGLDTGGGKIHFNMGWMIDPTHPIRTFLAEYGVLPVLVLALLWICVRRRKTKPLAAILVPTAIGLWILFNFVMLAPWDWDNIKLLAWCYLLVLPFLWELILAPLPLPLRSPLLVLLFFSGAVSLIGGLGPSHQKYRLTSLKELADAKVLLGSLPPDAVFAAQPTHAHPVLFAGRKLVMGYTGHLWSHGYEYAATEKRLESLLRGSPEWETLASELGADFIVWTQEERSSHPEKPGMPRPWEDSPALSSGDVRIYPAHR